MKVWVIRAFKDYYVNSTDTLGLFADARIFRNEKEAIRHTEKLMVKYNTSELEAVCLDIFEVKRLPFKDFKELFVSSNPEVVEEYKKYKLALCSKYGYATLKLNDKRKFESQFIKKANRLIFKKDYIDIDVCIRLSQIYLMAPDVHLPGYWLSKGYYKDEKESFDKYMELKRIFYERDFDVCFFA